MKSRVSMARALLTRRWPRRRIKLRAPTSDQHDREQMALMCGPVKPSMQPVEGRMPTITYDGDSWLVESAILATGFRESVDRRPDEITGRGPSVVGPSELTDGAAYE